MSIQTKPSTRRPSGFPRQATTIGGMMMFIAVVAFYAWCIQAATRGQAVLPLLVGIAIGYPFVAGPLVVKSRQWIKVDPGFDPIEPDSDQIPQLVSDSIARTVPDLKGLGFEWRGTFSHLNAVKNANAYVTLFENPEARRTAQLFTVFGASALSRQVVTVLAFRSAFTDGTRLLTKNSGVPSMFPRSDRVREGSGSFPWIKDAYRLYQVHEASVTRYASDGIPAPQDTSDPFEFLQESVRSEHAHFVEVGYVKLDEARGVYRYTWKGAILGAWKLTWPIKPIRLWLRRREAVRILREIGLEHYAMGA